MLIGITLWLVIGAAASFAVSRVVKLHGDDPRFSMAASAVAGLIGGFMYKYVSGAAIGMWNTKASLWAAIAGAIAAALWYTIRSMTANRTSYKPRSSY